MNTQRWIASVLTILGIFVVFDGASMAVAGEGDWLVRSRLIVIEPDDDADGTLGALAAGVESDLTVEIDATYFVTDSFAIEGILATASQEVTAGGGSTSLGSVLHAPATFLGQYHFSPDGKVRPYIGAGVNLTIFYDESGTLSTLSLDSSSFGAAAQAGIDFMIGEKSSFNVDLKYIQIETDVTSGSSFLGTVEVNPFVFGLGFGHRF